MSQAREMQLKLASQIVTNSKVLKPHLVAGVDVCSHRTSTIGTAAVVVLDYPGLNVVEVEREEASRASDGVSAGQRLWGVDEELS